MRTLQPAGKKKHCAACRKPTGGANDLCGGCAERFARIYGPKEEDQTMGTKGSKGQKLTSKVAGAPRALSHEGDRERTLAEVQDCLYEVVAGDTHHSEYGLADREAATRILQAMGDDGKRVVARAEAAWADRVELQKAKEAEDAEAKPGTFLDQIDETHRDIEETRVETDAAPPAPAAGKKADRIPAWRSTPARVLKCALECLKWYDWESLDLAGAAGATALLKHAYKEAVRREASAGRKPPKKVAVGVVCRVREKHRGAYDGLLDAADLVRLTVVGLNGKHARVRTAGGEAFLPRVEHLEVDPDAEQTGVAS